MAGRGRTVEQIVARVAHRRHGVVTRQLLLEAGVTAHEIDGRIARGALIVVHRGVFRVGHAAPSLEAAYLAAVLACGPGSLLGGLAACWMLRLAKAAPRRPTVWSPTERTIDGIRCLRFRGPRFSGGTQRPSGIPTVSVARALVDAAEVLPLGELARVCHEAGIKYRTTPRQVGRVLPANAKGARKLRSVMSGDAQVTLSPLEDAFRTVLGAVGLPLPVMNREASNRRVDCRWPGLGVTVELDSYTFHNSRHTWEQDRRREREAYARGDEFRRYTWGDVFEDSGAMLAELRSLLS